MNLIKLFVLTIFIIFAFLITGCSTTVPVTAKFPQAPESLLAKCPALTTIANNDISIIDLTKIVTQNYTTYYECSTKIEGWIEWYNSQKKIFDEVSE
jgi:hypothetical protein